METTNQKTDSAKVNIIDTQPCSVILSIEVASQEVLNETEKVYKEIQRAAQVQGFRQGKAPMELVKKNFTSTARERVIDNLIRQTAFSAIKNQGVIPIDSPLIKDVVFEFGKPFSYQLKVERHPEFSVKDYKGIKVNKEIKEITEDKINKNIESLCERNAKLEESKSDIIKDNHFVMVDYECFKDGQEIPEMKTKNQLIDLSSPQMLGDLKKGLTGVKKGEDKEVKVKLPADYPGKNLAGQEIVFKIKVKEIKEKVIPLIDDELAKDFGIENLEQLKIKVKETLEIEEKKRQTQEVEKQIVDSLLESNKFSVPQTMVEEQLKDMIDKTVEYYRRNGISQSECDKKIEEWNTKFKDEAERNVRLSYILNAISKEMKLEVTEEDLNAELEKMRKSVPGKEQEAEKYFNEHKEKILYRVKEEKLFAFLTDNAKIKETLKKD